MTACCADNDSKTRLWPSARSALWRRLPTSFSSGSPAHWQTRRRRKPVACIGCGGSCGVIQPCCPWSSAKRKHPRPCSMSIDKKMSSTWKQRPSSIEGLGELPTCTTKLSVCLLPSPRQVTSRPPHGSASETRTKIPTV